MRDKAGVGGWTGLESQSRTCTLSCRQRGSCRRVLNTEITCQNCSLRRPLWWKQERVLAGRRDCSLFSPRKRVISISMRAELQGWLERWEQSVGRLIDRTDDSFHGVGEEAKERELLEKTQCLLQVTRVAEQKYGRQDERKELLVNRMVSHFVFQL